MSRDPLQIASRMNLIEASGIRKFFDLSKTMKDPINLSIGQAHFDPPIEIQDAAIAAIRAGNNRYSVTQGIDELRNGVMAQMAARFTPRSDENVVITSGVSGGILLAYMATLNAGDEILIPDPYFVMYKHLANAIGVTPVCYSVFPDFEIRREALEAKLSDKTRVIFVNSPANPTGYVLSEAEIRIVCDFAREHNLLVISDEIYDFFIYDRPHVSPRSFYEHTLVLGGFSKNFGIPGWRLGYAFGPEKILEQMRVLQQFSFVCAPTPFQYAVAEGLKHDYSERVEEYRKKRDLIYEGLKDEFTLVKPEGAFYAFPQLPEGVGAMAFVERCIERNTLVVPGTACSTRDTNIRVSFAAEDEILKRGIDVLNAVARSFA